MNKNDVKDSFSVENVCSYFDFLNNEDYCSSDVPTVTQSTESTGNNFEKELENDVTNSFSYDNDENNEDAQMKTAACFSNTSTSTSSASALPLLTTNNEQLDTILHLHFAYCDYQLKSLADLAQYSNTRPVLIESVILEKLQSEAKILETIINNMDGNIFDKFSDGNFYRNYFLIV